MSISEEVAVKISSSPFLLDDGALHRLDKKTSVAENGFRTASQISWIVLELAT